MIKAIQRSVSIISRLWPALGAAIAEALWFRPLGRPRKDRPLNSVPFSGTVGRARFSGFTIGDGDIALLLHGWGGTSSDMSPIAVALAQAGYQAVALDLPGHGPDRRSRTDLFQMATAIGAVSAMFGSPRVVVAHSFGAAAAFTAFAHGGPDSVVFLAPAIRSERFLEFFREQLALSPRAYTKFRVRIERFAGPQILAIMQGEADIPESELLILHDPADDRTAYVDSQAFVADRPQAKLIPVPGTGHRGILSDDESISQILGFLG